MAPRRGGGGHISGGSSSGGSGSSGVPLADQPMNTFYFDLYSNTNLYGQVVVNAIWAATLLVVLLFINRKPAAKLVQTASFCFFTACIFLSVRWGLMIAVNWVPHGYRFEHSVVVLMQRLGVPILLAALIRAMKPSKILGAAPWVGVVILAALNITYIVYDFLLSDASVKEWNHTGGPWRLSDRDFAELMSKSMVGKYSDNPEYRKYATVWSLDDITRFRLWLMYDPTEPTIMHNRDIQIKIGLAADVIAMLLVLVIGGLHIVTWHRQGKAEAPRRRSLLAASVGVLLFSTLFRVIVVAHWLLPNWKTINTFSKWEPWLEEFPDTKDLDDYKHAPSFWLEGYRTTTEAFPILQAIFEQLGPVLACLFIAMSMANERQSFRANKEQEEYNKKMQSEQWQHQQWLNQQWQNPQNQQWQSQQAQQAQQAQHVQQAPQAQHG